MSDLPVPVAFYQSLQTQATQTVVEAALPPDPRVSFSRAMQTIWRRRWWFVLVFGAVTSLGAVFLLVAPLRYTSHAIVMVASRQPDLSGTDEVARALSRKDPDVDGEIQLIGSPAALRQVVKDLHLADRREFERALRNRGPGTLVAVRAAVDRRLGVLFGHGAVREPPAAPPADPIETIVGQLQQNLKVEEINKSTIVDIAATAGEPALAAEIANAVARNYTANRYRDRLQDAERAAEWLKQRSAELRQGLLAVESKVEQFRAKNAQLDGRDLEMLHQEIGTIDAKLTAAKIAQELANTKLATMQNMVRQIGPVAALGGDEGTLSARLREHAGQLHGRLAATLAATGPANPAVVQLGTEARRADSELARLTQAKMEALRGEAQVAARQTHDLEQMLAQVRAKYDQLNMTNVTLRSLDREASAARAVYESFLNRFKLTQQVGFDEAKSWLVSPATASRLPSSPRVPLVALATLVCALGAALSAVFLAEHRSHRGVLSAEQLTPRGLRPLALIPEFDRRTRRQGVVATVTNQPNSPFTEAIAGLYMSLVALSRKNAPSGSVVMCGSSLPFEGKSTTVAALAALIAATGKSVLLIDADLRSPSLHRIFGVRGRYGLANCLDSDVDLDELIHGDPVSGVSLLAAGRSHSRPQEALHSPQLREAVRRWRDRFDVVLIDTPPVLPIADARLLAPLADYCVFIVRWGKTGWNTAAHGLNLFKETGARIAGVALSRVNLKQLGTYDFADSEVYRGSYYRRYLSAGRRRAIPSGGG
jgi:capsular exopolysaccharide synthesis family protein